MAEGMNIFTLFGSILVDSSKADESIKKTEKNAEGFGGKLSNLIGGAAKVGAGIAAGVGVAGAAIFSLAEKAADAASAIDDSAQRTGMAADEFQKYAYAAKLSGIETGTLEGAMIKAQKSFADAKEGSKSISEAYSRLGIDINNIGTSSEAFDLVITRLAGMEDETQRNALANDIFGKSYAQLSPLLNEGADGINKLKQEAVDLGTVMSNESVEAGAKFGDTMDSLKMAVGGVMNGIGVQFLPILQKLADWVIDHMPEIQAVVGTTFRVIGDVIKAVWEILDVSLIPILKALWDWIEPNMPAIKRAIELSFGAIKGYVQGVVDIFLAVVGAIKDAVTWLGKFNNTPVQSKDMQIQTYGGYYPGMADGGTVAKSGLSWVGEKGPELLTLPGGATITPLNKLPNQSTINNNINIQNMNIRNDQDIKLTARELFNLQEASKRREAVSAI